MSAILSLKDVKKDFGSTQVLKGVSFDIPKGSVFAFLGANGAGKSTLLNIIMQILLPTSGEVFMNGEQILKDKIGVVFQENTFDEELSVYENIIIRGRLYGIKKKILEKRILQLSRELGMETFLHSKYKVCSGGQKRISMVARSLIMNPSIIIMDEPTTAIDIETRRKLWNFLLKLNKERGVTIFFSSHYIEEANIASNICILNSGKIIFSGTYQQLISNYSRKELKINFKDEIIKREISSVKSALCYLEQLDDTKIDTFSLQNSNLEDIFLRLVYHDNASL